VQHEAEQQTVAAGSVAMKKVDFGDHTAQCKRVLGPQRSVLSTMDRPVQ
jgi:hypothetical protein